MKSLIVVLNYKFTFYRCTTSGELQYNLDPDSEETISIYLSHLVEKSAVDKKKNGIKESSTERLRIMCIFYFFLNLEQ